MENKTIQLQIPEYVSIQQYADINSYKGDSIIHKLIHTVSLITGIDQEEVKHWSIDSLTKVGNIYSEIADHKEEFHSLVEWNGVLYGYAHIKQSTLAQYYDLEILCKDIESNMHKIAAILYRPVVDHRFKELKFITKQKIKMVNNDVENVFDWYELEKYTSKQRKKVEEDFRDFPVHIFLGALSFFLTNASQYLNHIAYSRKMMTKTEMKKQNEVLLGSLLANIGAGGGLFTTSLSPIFYQYQGMSQ